MLTAEMRQAGRAAGAGPERNHVPAHPPELRLGVWLQRAHGAAGGGRAVPDAALPAAALGARMCCRAPCTQAVIACCSALLWPSSVFLIGQPITERMGFAVRAGCGRCHGAEFCERGMLVAAAAALPPAAACAQVCCLGRERGQSRSLFSSKRTAQLAVLIAWSVELGQRVEQKQFASELASYVFCPQEPVHGAGCILLGEIHGCMSAWPGLPGTFNKKQLAGLAKPPKAGSKAPLGCQLFSWPS